MGKYILRAYMVQSAVMAITSLLLFIYFCIKEMHQTPLEVGPLGGSGMTIILFLIFEIIVFPVNTICLTILKYIRCNRVKIETNKSIVIFAILYELLCFANLYVSAIYFESFFWWGCLIVYLVIIFGIIASNYLRNSSE